MDLEEQFGIKLSVIIAGFVGGIVSLTYETKISAIRAVLLITSGASVAAYLQPAIQHWMNFPPQLANALGFVLGLSSMKVVQFITHYTEIKLQGQINDARKELGNSKRDSGTEQQP